MKITRLVTLPERLTHMADPPHILFHAGADLSELLSRPCVAIVGSRAVSPYGKQVTETLARQLAERGIVIISGLAFGIDSIAHQAALDAGGLTIAVLPGPVECIFPRSHERLGRAIVEAGGALISEYPAGTPGLTHQFVARNRLVAGLADAVLITEAALKSGSLHTARFALEQGRDVLSVPGNITSQGSIGTNNLIKAGAVPITSYTDVLHILNLSDDQTIQAIPKGRNNSEQLILDLLLQGVSEGQELHIKSSLSATDFNQTLSMLEITGKIRSLGSNQWRPA